MHKPTCDKCGSQVKPSDSFCINCGARIIHVDVDNYFDPNATLNLEAVHDNCNTEIIVETNSPTIEDGDTQVIDDSDTQAIEDTNTQTLVVEHAQFESTMPLLDDCRKTEQTIPFDDESQYISNTTTPPGRKKNSSPWLWVTSLLLFFLGAAAAVYYFGFRSNESLQHTERVDNSDATDNDDAYDNEFNDNITVVEENRVDPNQTSTPDLLFNDLHGRVKSVTTQSGIIEFDALGNMTTASNQTLTRDGRGYIIGSEIYDVDNSTIFTNYKFDGTRYTGWEYGWKNEPANIPPNITQTCTYSYNSAGFLSKITIIHDSAERVIEYSNYQTDNHGNWISRDLRSTLYYNDNYTGETLQDTDTDTETRSIAYYD